MVKPENRKSFFLITLMAFLLAIPVFSQTGGVDLPFGPGDFDPATDVTITAIQLPETARTREIVQVKLKMEIPEGYHITKELFEINPVDESFKLVEVRLPKGEASILGEVLGGTINVDVAIVPLKAGSELPYTVTFQSCSEGENPMCFPPVDVAGNFQITVETGKQTLADRLTAALGSSMLLALLIIFIGGIGASLTPCVYPVIPLTVAYVGARSEGKKFRGFILSVMLVLGIATTYSVLGIISAKTGSVFGSLAQHPVFITVLAFIFIAMGLSMFGFYDIQLPAALNSKLQVQRKGLMGAFLMGMATGVLAAPCVGPIIVVLLGWVAQTGSTFKGFLFLFDFALGMGVLFILIGTFSGVMASLPKAGGWMIKVKYIFGIMFFLAAVLFAKPILGSYFYPAMILAVLPLLMALFLSRLVNKTAGIVLLLVFLAGLIGVQFLKGDKDHGVLNYEAALTQALDQAKAEDKLVVLDFYADWCAACKELDEYTWADDAVKNRLSESGILLKLDFTKTSAEGKIFQDRYTVYGLPTVVFLAPDGTEKGRFVGFRNAEDFLKLMAEAQAR